MPLTNAGGAADVRERSPASAATKWISRRPAHMAAALAIGLFGVALLQGISYWPGIMTWDAINQYGQEVDGEFDDWHPPAMAWLWRQLITVKVGPGPMFVLQLVLYWTGYATIVGAALRRRRTGMAFALAACALLPFPLAIMGSVLKDCLMEGVLLSAVGLLLWVKPERDWAVRIWAILMLLFAATLRFNAFLATLPLLVALLPMAWRRTQLRLAAVSAVSLSALVLAIPVANRLIGAERSGVELSLVVFDLGGITRFSGVDVFPAIAVADPVAVNARCYRPDKWDSYSTWAAPLCPIGFDTITAAFAASGRSPYWTLAEAVLAHPIAYAQHRLGHFNINSRFLVHTEVQGPAPDRAIPNEWNYVVDSNAGLRLINRMAGWSIHSPLGWPIWWMALALGLLALSPELPSRRVVIPITLSALLYGLGYLLFSVSSELRYHLWTITGTAIAAVIAGADLAAGAPVSRRRLILSAQPALVVLALCTLWRLT